MNLLLQVKKRKLINLNPIMKEKTKEEITIIKKTTILIAIIIITNLNKIL